MTSSVSALEEKIAFAAETEAGLRTLRGDTSQRKTALVMDLNFERRRVRELLQQVKVLEARAAKRLAADYCLHKQSRSSSHRKPSLWRARLT
jgi:hypothetical protein